MASEIENIEEIQRSYRNKLAAVKSDFHRELFYKIDWEDRLICIKGPKGTGKTTMMLQRIKENFHNTDKALYISLDNLWFASHNIMDLVDYHYSHEGTKRTSSQIQSSFLLLLIPPMQRGRCRSIIRK